MIQKATIVGFFVAVAIFGLFVPMGRLFDAFQPLTVTLSIMAAALLVRLNRGMPTLDWKSIEPDARRRLTKAVVIVTREYMVIATMCAFLLVTLLALATAGKSAIELWIEPIQRALSGAVGGMAVLCISRMGYVVWRDYDIVRVQKEVIDASADKDEREREEKAADEKVAGIRAANIRNISPPSPKDWGA